MHRARGGQAAADAAIRAAQGLQSAGQRTDKASIAAVVASTPAAKEPSPVKVLLDEQPCQIQAATVRQAIQACAEMARRGGRIIVDVFVDGDRWSDEQLTAAAADRPAQVVSLTSADPHALVSYTFAEAADVLPEIQSLQESAAGHIQAARLPQAMEQLGQAIELWLAVQQAVASGAALIELDLEAVQAGGRSVSACLGDLRDRLGVMRAALQNRDPVGLSDTLLYEMPAVIDCWSQLLKELRRVVETAPPPPPPPPAAAAVEGSARA